MASGCGTFGGSARLPASIYDIMGSPIGVGGPCIHDARRPLPESSDQERVSLLDLTCNRRCHRRDSPPRPTNPFWSTALTRLTYHGPMRHISSRTSVPSTPSTIARPGASSHQRWVALVRRLLPVAIFFAIAFVLDHFTRQQYSAVFGSAAIIASVLSVFPAVRPAALGLGGYGLVWILFNLGRAVADNAGLAIGGRNAVSSFEANFFGGTLPSQWLQDRFHSPDRIELQSVGLAVVHLSFFVVPFVVAAMLWFRQRVVFIRYGWATAIAFGLGLIGFVLLPTAPPWMSNPDTVSRITVGALGGDGTTSALPGAPTAANPALGFEPNHVAALPSVHVVAAVLVFLALRAVSPRWQWVGAAYAVAMTVAVIYLGEHFLLDAVLGWVVAVIGWGGATWVPQPSRTSIVANHASEPDLS